MIRLIAALVLALPASAQTRVAPASVGGLSLPLAPFAHSAPAFAPSLASPALPLAPVLAPSFAPAFAAPVPLSLAEGRAFFDGAAAKPEPPAAPEPAVAPRGDTVDLHGTALPSRMFSDKTRISGHLIRAIDSARDTIDIALHGLALREVAEALSRAKKRGVKVRVVMNQTHVFPEKPRDTRSPEIQRLIDEGFEMRMLRGGDQFGVMHNKIAIFDGLVLETGSYNWTHAADTWHWENALFLAEAARVAAFQAYWNWMWSISSAIPAKAPKVPVFEGDPGQRPALPPAPQDPARPVRFNGEDLPAQVFSPGGATAHLVRALDAARVSVDVANFSFTSEALRDALLRAKERGVAVRIVFDEGQYKFLSEMHWFVQNGFDVRLAKGKKGDKGVMHNKYAVLDGKLVADGSFNWTRNAEKNNYENLLFLDAPDDVAAFAAFFERIRDEGREPGQEDHLGPQHMPEDFNPAH